jgi:membrane protein
MDTTLTQHPGSHQTGANFPNPKTSGFATTTSEKPTLKERAKSLFANISKHEILLLAGSLAYTTALSIAPFILILLSFASFLSDSLQSRLYKQLSNVAGAKAGETIQGIIENANKHPSASGISGIIGLIVLAVSASAIFAQLRVSLDKINEHQDTAESSGLMGFLKERFLSVGLVFGFAFLSIASLMVTTVLAMLFEGTEGVIWQVISFAVTFLAFAVLFAAIYRFVPSDTLSWRRCAISGVVSAIFYIIGKALIGIYLAKAGLESSYGAAGSLVVFLAWVFYTTLTILVSYEFSSNLLGRESLGTATSSAKV